MIKCFCIVALLLGGLVGKSQPKDRSIVAGDDAPQLAILEWLKGTPVNKFESGKLYVVEFSGTWCGPCMKAIPHLSRTTDNFKDRVTIISVFNELNDVSKPEDLSYVEKVRKLVNFAGDKITYSVGVDDPLQTTSHTYGVNAYPTAFVIDGNRMVLWKGHPEDLDGVLQGILEKKINLKDVNQRITSFGNTIYNLYNNKRSGDKMQVSTFNHIIDSLSKGFPEKAELLWTTKFYLLAGTDDQAAYDFVKSLINSKEKPTWSDFVRSLSFIRPQNRNYEIDLEVLRRALEEEFILFSFKAPYYAKKAEIYGLMKKFDKAANAQTEALLCSMAPGVNEERVTSYKKQLIIYLYESKLQDNSIKANEWLHDQVLASNIDLDPGLIDIMLQNGQKEVAAKLTISVLQKKVDPAKASELYGKLADITDDRKQALSYIEKAIEFSKESNQGNLHEAYKKKYEEIKKNPGKYK